jgi:hypothetical protein
MGVNVMGAEIMKDICSGLILALFSAAFVQSPSTAATLDEGRIGILGGQPAITKSNLPPGKIADFNRAGICPVDGGAVIQLPESYSLDDLASLKLECLFDRPQIKTLDPFITAPATIMLTRYAAMDNYKKGGPITAVDFHDQFQGLWFGSIDDKTNRLTVWPNSLVGYRYRRDKIDGPENPRLILESAAHDYDPDVERITVGFWKGVSDRMTGIVRGFQTVP